MSEMIGEDNIRECLTAFADGELDAAHILAVLDYLTEHPEGLQLMRTQQRLRIATERALRTLTPPPPAALRKRVEAMALESAAASRARPWFQRRGWQLPAIAAAFLLTGVLAGRTLFAPSAGTTTTHQPPVIATGEPVVPAITVAHATRVHADCSRLQEGLHTAGYPKEVKGLADLVTRDLRGSNPYPDLARIGYRFVGAGPCGDPLVDTIHLLYESTEPGHKRTVSVFVQQNKRQFRLDAGKLYVVSGPASPFPMYAWRTEHVVYFLLADNEPAIREARQEIAVAPPPPRL